MTLRQRKENKGRMQQLKLKKKKRFNKLIKTLNETNSHQNTYTSDIQRVFITEEPWQTDLLMKEYYIRLKRWRDCII